MPALDLKPGDHPTWRTDLNVRLLPGTHAWLNIPGKPGCSVTSAEGPDATFIDAQRGEFALRGNDGCHGLHLEGFTVLNAGHGVRVTQADHVTVKNLVGHDCAVEVLHLGHCAACQVDGVKGWNLGKWRFQTYGADQAHLVYLAEPGNGAVVRNVDGKDCGGSLVQVNAASTQEHTRNLLIENAVGENCGWGGGGTFPFSLMSVTDSEVRNFLLRNSKGIAALHDDGQGADYACYRVAFHTFTLEGTPNRTVLAGGSDATNTFIPGAGWSPGSPTLPPPVDPPAGMSEADQTAAIRDLQRRVTALERAA